MQDEETNNNVDDSQEWDDAVKEFSEEQGVESEEPKQEPEDTGDDGDNGDDAESDDTPDEPQTREEPEDKGDEQPKEESKPDDGLPDTQPAYPSLQEQRSYQRQVEAEEKVLKEEIRNEMFSDTPNELLDAEGYPIKTVEDVQQHINPNTGERFTAEEATIYLFQAQQHLEKQQAEVEQKVNEIANVNLDLKDQADSVRNKWGELLDAMPDLKKQVWAAYEATLIKHKGTDIIEKAPVSMESFYDISLSGYAKLAEQMAVQADAETQAKAAQDAQAQEVKKKQQRSDREDIYSAGKTDTMDDEEKEWQKVAKEFYED